MSLIGVVAAAAGEPSPNVVVVLALLLAGLALTMLGLSFLTGRRRSVDEAVEQAADDAPEGVSAPAPEPTAPAPAPAPRVGPCDWELQVDTDDGVPVVLRRAAGRRCCVHTIRLQALDPRPPEPSESEYLTWSGDRTRVGPRRASTRTRRDVVSAGASWRPLGIALSGSIRRGPGPTFTTSDDGAPDDDDGMRAERLWARHLRTLQEEEVRTQPDDATVTAEHAATDRQRVEVDVTKGCDRGHHLSAHGEAAVTITGETDGAPTGALEAPRVAAWLDGDLGTAATTVASASPDVRVEPVPDDPVGMAVTNGTRRMPLSAVLVGQGRAERDDAGLAVVLGAAAAVRVAVGPPSGRTADGSMSVAIDHLLVVTVTPVERAAGGVDRLQCACAPAYELQLGELPHGGSVPASPAGRVVVDGRAYLLRRVRGATSGSPSRWVVDGAQSTETAPDESEPDARGSQTNAGTVADGGRPGAGQHVDGAAGRADGHPAGDAGG